MHTIRLLAVGSLLFVPLAARAVVVTTCGQVVAGTADLTGDLDCSGHLGDSLYLAGKLRLNGFTLTGNPGSAVVKCEMGSCKVEGPGTVTGGLDGIESNSGAKVALGAVISGNAADGVRSDRSAKVTDSTVQGNGGDGVRSKARATIVNSSVVANAADGVRADSSIRVTNSLVSGNGEQGVDSDKNATAKLSQITANGLYGIRGIKVTLKDSTATGNGTSPACGVITDDCTDVAADFLPKLKGTSSCGTSTNTLLGGTWGVCSLD